jgi:hypothetical protein
VVKVVVFEMHVAHCRGWEIGRLVVQVVVEQVLVLAVAVAAVLHQVVVAQNGGRPQRAANKVQG